MANGTIPVIDLFAGPGGLGEGFSAFKFGDLHPFDVRLSIEKDDVACQTLRLRKFFRAFEEPPAEYDAAVRGELELDALYDTFPRQAEDARIRTWRAELGKTTQTRIYRRVRAALGDARGWVLLGGPPCQAYSIVGRSRMKGRPDFEEDQRHFLYREYLRIVAHQRPTIFVMENVKGMLSATHGGKRMFEQICADLRAPGRAVRITRSADVAYDLYALAESTQRSLVTESQGSFLVRAEDYGIPQRRHRVFIVGVRRDDATPVVPRFLDAREPISTKQALGDLPRLRSRLSRELDSPEAWMDAVAQTGRQEWCTAKSGELSDVARFAREVISRGVWPRSTGGTSYEPGGRASRLSEWYRSGASSLTMHDSRPHMRSDLWRYFFCACFAAVRNRSPELRNFPVELRPAHKNVGEAIKGEMFGDRFSVQLAERPASTITSHIAKDGHYFIHYEPEQCRSFTAREAARIQTFPDNYFFVGSRTNQFHQIGNAVPPLLARDIAAVVMEVFREAVNGRYHRARSA